MIRKSLLTNPFIKEALVLIEKEVIEEASKEEDTEEMVVREEKQGKIEHTLIMMIQLNINNSCRILKDKLSHTMIYFDNNIILLQDSRVF